jgi:type IV secretory pathway VirB2 component (pilin)
MIRKALRRFSAVIALILLVATPAFASSAGMPWEGPLNRLVQSLTGPVAKAIGVFAIVAVGFGMAFSEGGSGMRKVLWVVLGLAIAFSAASWGLSFMGFSGGLSV